MTSPAAPQTSAHMKWGALPRITAPASNDVETTRKLFTVVIVHCLMTRHGDVAGSGNQLETVHCQLEMAGRQLEVARPQLDTRKGLGMYCLPSTANDVGGARIPEFVGNSHSSFPVEASKAWSLRSLVPPLKTSPPPVASIEPQVGLFG